MLRFRSYWIYDAGLIIAWVVILTLAATIKGWVVMEHILWVMFGFCVGWVSTTIARHVHPPPRHWRASHL